jgi:hypothetical protein
MQSLPLTVERQQTERKTVQTMAQNSFPEKFIKKSESKNATKSPQKTG